MPSRCAPIRPILSRAPGSTPAKGPGRGEFPPGPGQVRDVETAYGIVGQLAGCGWSMRIPVFGVPAGR